MCYSAQLNMRFKSLKEMLKAEADYAAFQRLYEARQSNDSIKIPKALDANFYDAKTPAEKRILALINEYQATKIKQHEEDLFKQKKRQADATRKLALKETKAARESQRIAANKIKWHIRKLDDLKRTKAEDKDSRIFPMWYAPVVVMEDEKRVIKPMRYHCRPHGKPEHYDRKFDGLYNARRDNLEGFWKGQFGHTHAVAVMLSFYENVALHDYEHRELRPDEGVSNVVLHFNPQPKTDMLVACLWSHWQGKSKDDLYSFAAITDEPPPEIAATGHERCIIPLKDKNVDAWLNPNTSAKDEMYRLMDNRERPHYAHELAA